ncbi:hypothetical protein L486_03956 [Kwoniella mangroviensis CBS 10435]|uniref:DUF7918 domain-containing protein n=1 Tax=Kwoniella mangroviensis CBS 10435 TaxID=1331196 RepID=A0A1B9IQW2_9TREE|nr:hypothetical protein L486_03956 [Kwoniella mangroviensis CBS 10435]
MKGSAEYNDLEVWVECDGTRLNEYHQTFEEKRDHQPPIYKSYLEIGDSTNSKYTFHVKNNSITKWLDSLLSNIEVDNYLLCTAYLHPEEGYKVSQSQVYRSEAEKKGNGKVVEHVHSQLVDDKEEDSQRIVLLDSHEGFLGRITISIFRGSLSESQPMTHQDAEYEDSESEIYNGITSLNVLDPSKAWENWWEDDVDPWIRFVYTYGTRKALIANKVDLPSPEISPAVRPEAEIDEILVPDSTPPSPFAFTSDPFEDNLLTQGLEELGSALQSLIANMNLKAGPNMMVDDQISSVAQPNEEKTSDLSKVDPLRHQKHTSKNSKEQKNSIRATSGWSDKDQISDNRLLKSSRCSVNAEKGSEVDNSQAGPSTAISSTRSPFQISKGKTQPTLTQSVDEASPPAWMAHPQAHAKPPTHRQALDRPQSNLDPPVSLQAEVNRQEQLSGHSEYTKLLEAIDNPSSTNLTEKEIDLLLRALTDNQESITATTGRSHRSPESTAIPHGSKGKGKEKIDERDSDKNTNTNYYPSNSVSVSVSVPSFERPLPDVSAKDYAYQPSPTIEENDINSLDYLAKEGMNEAFLQNLFNADTSPSERNNMPKLPKARWETIQSFNAKQEDERQRKLFEDKESRKWMQELAKRRRLDDRDIKRREGERRRWLNLGKHHEQENRKTQKSSNESVIGRKYVPVGQRKRSRHEDEDEIERRIEEKKRRLRELDRLEKVRKPEGRGRCKEEAIDLTLSD